MPIQDGTAASTTKWATNALRIKLLENEIQFWHLGHFLFMTLSDDGTICHPFFKSVLNQRKWTKHFITLFVTCITVGYHADKTFK